MAKAQPDHYYGFGVGAHKCVRCGVMRRPLQTLFGKPHSWKTEWSHDGGATWTKVHTACSMGRLKSDLTSALAVVGGVSALSASASTEIEAVIAWLWSEDARRYTEVGPLIAKAIEEGRYLPFLRQT